MDVMTELKGQIGIISPYKSQVRSIKDQVFKLLKSEFSIYDPQNYVEVGTVDGF
jgi:superfamily I DNA and/or RNA helicase